jgi:hypothetical protein
LERRIRSTVFVERHRNAGKRPDTYSLHGQPSGFGWLVSQEKSHSSLVHRQPSH